MDAWLTSSGSTFFPSQHRLGAPPHSSFAKTDRYRPSFERPSGTAMTTGGRSRTRWYRKSTLSNLRDGKMVLNEARKRVVKKYRRFARQLEYQRLRSILPSLRDQKYVSKVKILHEAIKYIDYLHRRALMTVEKNGFFGSLHVQEEEEEESSSREVPCSTGSGSSSQRDRSMTSTQIGRTISLIQEALQGDIQRKLELKRQMDQANVKALLSSLEVAAVRRAREERSSADKDAVKPPPKSSSGKPS